MKKPACPKEQDGNQNGSHEWGGSENTEPVVEAEVKVKVAQWCLTLCDPMDFIVYGILQARILEWVAFPFYRGFSQPREWTQVSWLQVDSLPAEP